jgi:hypothetical protein
MTATILHRAMFLGLFAAAFVPFARGDEPSTFRVGVAERDVTPEKPTPMWGYGARHDKLSEGVLDRLKAKAVVIQAGDAKLAIVGMDLGRGPTPAMMERIRGLVSARKIANVLICGSHTHHGPVIELTDRPGYGKGKFDDAVAYAGKLPDLIAGAILDADDKLEPAEIRIAGRDLELNRNRHAKHEPKPVDPRLTVIRFDRPDGAPIAVLVHFAAHPVMTPGAVLKFSADYPGALRNTVEEALKVPCLFIQGAAGNLSPNPTPDDRGDPAKFGRTLGLQAVEAAESMKQVAPVRPTLGVASDRFEFPTRINLKSAVNLVLYGRSFFPELVRNVLEEYGDGMKPETTTVLLGDQLGIVALPGEPFCQHATRLRERAGLPHALVFGYCNGHFLYFPTIEAAAEGGYGADTAMSPIALGAGERMVDRALIDLFKLRGKFPGEPPRP